MCLIATVWGLRLVVNMPYYYFKMLTCPITILRAIFGTKMLYIIAYFKSILQ